MTQLFTNNATTTLAAGITAGATSMAVAAGAGAKFPSPTAGDYFMLTLFQMVSGIESNYEVVKVTGRSVDTLTIVRGQEGTTARAFITGDQVSLRATASAMNNFAQLASGGTFGAPIFAPTAVAGTSTTQVATTAFATTAVANAVATLIGTAPGVLDTLGELADALADDAGFSTTVTTALGNRLRVDTAAQGLTGTQKTNAATNLGLAAVATSGAKADVGLGNADNTSDVNKPVSTAQLTALNLKAPLASPVLTGNPTAPTVATATDSSTSIATTAFVQAGMAAFGLGGISAAPLILNLDDVTVGAGMYYVNGSTTGTYPSGAAPGFLLHKIYGGAGFQMFQPYATDHLYYRRRNSTTWAAWTELASLASPAFSGTPTAPTAAANTNTTQIATTAFVSAAVTALINSSPAALDTLNELAAALGNDPSFATTMTNALAAKAPLASPALTGVPIAPTAAANTNTTQLATTAFVAAAAATKAALAGSAAQSFAANDLALTSMNGGPLAGFRNVMVNGDMRVSQRALPVTGGYGIDRWFLNTAGTGLSMTQPVASPSLPGEPVAIALNLTGAAGNTAHNIFQRIESTNSRHLAGKSVTLSFWHYNNTSTAQIVKCALDYATAGLDNFGTTTNIGTSAGTTCPTGQWTFVSATFTVPTAATNGLQATLGTGYGAVVAGQSVAYGNVQLELGAVATPFERRPYTTELMLCQRYYEAISMPAIFTGSAGTATAYYLPCLFKVAKRAAPTIGMPSSSNAAWDANGVSITPSTWASRDITTNGFGIWADNNPRPGGIAANIYTASAEL